MEPHRHSFTTTVEPGDAPGRTYLDPHHTERDWRMDGVTAPPDLRCQAVSVAASSESDRMQCPKLSAVLILTLFMGQESQEVSLCGGHYSVHRSGKELELAWPA